jgi:hypothetical protein
VVNEKPTPLFVFRCNRIETTLPVIAFENDGLLATSGEAETINQRKKTNESSLTTKKHQANNPSVEAAHAHTYWQLMFARLTDRCRFQRSPMMQIN